MLVLSRKQLDTIVIDRRIRIRVLEIRGDRIRLGIEAPQDVPILRGELETTAEKDLDGQRWYAQDAEAARMSRLRLETELPPESGMDDAPSIAADPRAHGV